MEEGRGECIFEVGLGSEPPGSNESCDAEDSEQASGTYISKTEIVSTAVWKLRKFSLTRESNVFY